MKCVEIENTYYYYYFLLNMQMQKSLNNWERLPLLLAGIFCPLPPFTWLLCSPFQWGEASKVNDPCKGVGRKISRGGMKKKDRKIAKTPKNSNIKPLPGRGEQRKKTEK